MGVGEPVPRLLVGHIPIDCHNHFLYDDLEARHVALHCHVLAFAQLAQCLPNEVHEGSLVLCGTEGCLYPAGLGLLAESQLWFACLGHPDRGLSLDGVIVFEAVGPVGGLEFGDILFEGEGRDAFSGNLHRR